MQSGRTVQRWSVRIGAVVSLLSMPSLALANLEWTPWVSEEDGHVACAEDEAVVGVGCAGDYCDSVQLLCETAPFGITFVDHRWSAFYSEESSGLAERVSHAWFGSDTDNMHVCRWQSGQPGVMTGIRCRGDYCDDISIECATPVKVEEGSTLTVNAASCGWSGWHSEEQGHWDFGSNRYIMGVECRGDYCDDKRYFVCSLFPADA